MDDVGHLAPHAFCGKSDIEKRNQRGEEFVPLFSLGSRRFALRDIVRRESFNPLRRRKKPPYSVHTVCAERGGISVFRATYGNERAFCLGDKCGRPSSWGMVITRIVFHFAFAVRCHIYCNMRYIVNSEMLPLHFASRSLSRHII